MKNLYYYCTGQFGNDKSAIYEIIKLYENLIIKNSFINGRFDEDCRAYIEYCLIQAINNFKFF